MEPAPWRSRAEGTCLVTDTGTFLQSLLTKLFVRPCYPELFALCKAKWAAGAQGIFILGTPGVGKSCFLDYALHGYLYDATDRKNVLYLHGPQERAYLFQHGDGGATTVTGHKLSDVLDGSVAIPSDSFDVVFYDPHESAERTNDVHISFFKNKEFVVPISPDKENCKKLRKDTRSKTKLYMGTLSEQEAEAMRASCYTNVTAELLQARYPKIGGIARQLFETPLEGEEGDETVNDVEERQTAALNDIAQNPLRIDAGEVAAEFKNLWSLYHLQPVNENGHTNYGKYTIELFFSDVRARIRDKLMNKDVSELWNLYDSTLERHGTLRDIRYEAYAHKKIMTHGVNSTSTSLTVNGVGRATKQIVIPASLPKINLSTNDLGAQFQNDLRTAHTMGNGAYLLPVCSNFPVVDALFSSRNETVSLQMKAGRSKPLSGPSASAIQHAAGGCLVFVVPDENIILRKLGYTEGAGPEHWRHYRLVLKET